MRGWQVAQFLLPLPQSHAEQPAAAQRDECLPDVIPDERRVVPDLQVLVNALSGVGQLIDQDDKRDAANSATGGQLKDVGAGEKEHCQRGQHDQCHRAHIRLHHDQAGHHADQHGKRDQSVGHVADLVTLGGQPGRDIDHQRRFRQFAGLNRTVEKRPPRPKTIIPQKEHQDQQQQRTTHNRHRHLSPPIVRDRGSHHHHAQAQAHPQELP